MSLETPVTHTAQGFQWLLGFAKLVVLLLRPGRGAAPEPRETSEVQPGAGDL